MKKITLSLVLGFGLLMSCSEVNEPVVNQEKTIFNLDFENDNEGFTSLVDGPVISINKKEFNSCGALYIGGNKDFTSWNGYDFKGNKTRFLGLDMGGCLGYFGTSTQVKFQILEALPQGEAKITFKYYMPGNFTGWGNDYVLNVYIEKGGIVYPNANNDIESLMKFEAKINQNGWVDFSEDIPADLPSGEYNLVVEMIGSSAAIDDIKLIKKETVN